MWSFGTYVQSAKIHYKHVYGKTKLREDLYHCIDLIKEATERFPQKPEGPYYLGIFYSEINAIDTVVMYFTKVQEMCDDESIEKKDRKHCYKKDKWIEKMKKQRQDFWEKSYNSAIDYMTQGDAAEDMSKVPGISDDSIAVLKGLVIKAYAAAMDDFHSADIAKPNDAKTMESMAVLLQREDKHLEAIEYYKRVMEIEGGEEKADKSLIEKIAYAYIYIPDWDKSIEWFEKVSSMQPDDINALINLAISYRNVDNNDKWFEYTEKVLELQPENTEFLFNAGQYWFVSMQDIATIIADSCNDENATTERCKKLEEEANAARDKAAGFFEKIAEINPSDTDALRQLGILNLLGQNPQGAIDALEKYIAVDPSDNDVLDFLGRAYILSGDSKAAIRPYELKVENDPGDADTWERLGDLYEYNSMADKATEARAKAKELRDL